MRRTAGRKIDSLPANRSSRPGAGAPEDGANCCCMSAQQLHGAFGQDTFGRRAEAAARFLGTLRYIAAQSMVVVIWIAVNATAVALRRDPYPFILLNLAFSTQAAYAAPLILLAQTRQANRDKLAVEALEAPAGRSPARWRSARRRSSSRPPSSRIC